MTTTLVSKAEQLAKKAEDYPSIFGSVNLTNIRENVNEILKLIGRDGIFREYTLHDANHIDAMLALADKLIPADTAANMKTADWFMIVLSCYFHDLGMLVTKDEYDNRYNGTGFPLFKASLLNGDKGKDYEEALSKLLEEEREEFMYQEFVRANHAKRIFHWIQGQDAPQYGDARRAVEAINRLLSNVEIIVRDDLAKICLSHHEDDLFDFEKYQINRVYGDDPEGEANIHYAALILRSVDVLQIQKKRVPSVLYQLIDPSNPKSQEEWAKQAGVRSVKPKLTPSGEYNTIEIHASFDKESAYFGLLAYLQQYAGKELERCYEWAKQAQKRGSTFLFPWRLIDSSQVEPRGFEGRSYSFKLDQEKILKLLTGHTLYNDSRVAIREVLQNALDAVRFRKYLFQDEPIGKIEVIWESKERKLIIRDTGTGMTQETIENFLLNVGSSYYQSEAVQQKHTGFSAISRFGIGVLSTFMIADEVQILTVHPDEDVARRLTLPSVVKSYLVKKIPKSSPEVMAIGPHGTEVVLQVRRSADLKDVEAFVRHWLVLPQCEITCKTDDFDPVKIGFSTAQEVIDYYYKRNTEKNPWKREIDIRIETMPGIELAYIVSKSNFTHVWDFEKQSERRERALPEENNNLSAPPGICVEGIRVRSVPAGYDQRDNAPWVFVNLSGPNAPKTNVARSDIEQTTELENILFQIYCLIGNHIQMEFNRLLAEKSGIVEAASEADFIRSLGLEKCRQSDHGKYMEAMASLRVIALEDESICRSVSLKEIETMKEIWTVDSRLIRNLEGISGTLGINLPTKRIIETLGKSIDPNIPMPRVLGYSKYPLLGRDVSKIRIYPEERTHRVDLCWEIEKPGRWKSIPRHLIKNIAGYVGASRSGNPIFITGDEEISSDCPDYDLVEWRRCTFILATSGLANFLDAIGMNEHFVNVLMILITKGEIPSERKSILKDQLYSLKGQDGLDMLNCLALPFERRFGEFRGSDRESLSAW